LLLLGESINSKSLKRYRGDTNKIITNNKDKVIKNGNNINTTIGTLVVKLTL